MKKIFLNITFMIVMLSGASLSSYADCFTGFACSINDLENKELAEQADKFIPAINDYFSMKLNDADYFDIPQSKNYIDLFTFNTLI